MFEKYDLSQLEEIDLAAAEYALGSLDEAENARFEALLAFSHDTQIKVARWQQHVQLCLHDFEPTPAPKHLWPRIAEQLGHQSKSRSWLNNLKLWRGFSAFAMALAMVLIISPWKNSTNNSPTLELVSPSIQPPSIRSPDLNYVIYNVQHNPAWIVNASLSQNNFSIDTIAPDPMEQGMVCELWLIVDSGDPISLGILPKEGSIQVDFDTRITGLNNWEESLQQGTLVISLETSSLDVRIDYEMGPVLEEGLWVSAMSGPVIHL